MECGLLITPAFDHKALGVNPEFSFTNVDRTEGLVEGFLGREPFRISIFAKAMEADHYLNPVFEVTLANRRYCFELENGRACFGCAIRLSCRILAMLRETEEVL